MMKPLRNLLLIEAIEEQQISSGGIHIAGVKEVKQRTGTVLAAGPGTIIDGKFVATAVKVGDNVMFLNSDSQEIKLEGKSYRIVAEANLIGVIRD